MSRSGAKCRYYNAMATNNYFKTPKYKGFDSRFEFSKYQELEVRLKAKDIKEFWCQYPIDIISNGYLISVYKMDFVILHNDGTLELLETKGLPTKDWVLRWKMLCAMYIDHPGIKLTVEYQKQWSGKVYKEPVPKKLPKNYVAQF